MGDYGAPIWGAGRVSVDSLMHAGMSASYAALSLNARMPRDISLTYRRGIQVAPRKRKASFQVTPRWLTSRGLPGFVQTLVRLYRPSTLFGGFPPPTYFGWRISCADFEVGLLRFGLGVRHRQRVGLDGIGDCFIDASEQASSLVGVAVLIGQLDVVGDGVLHDQ